MKLVNWLTYQEYGNKATETYTKPSQTIPGMTMGLDELLRRYTMKQAIPMLTPIYGGEDPDFPDHLERMDPMDRLDMAREIKGAIQEKQVELSARQRRRLEEKEKEKEDETNKPATKEGGLSPTD